jgi:hypothetical protein
VDESNTESNKELVMGELLIQRTRAVASEISTLQEEVHTSIFADPSGFKLIEHIQTLPAYQSDILLIQKHAEKHNISLDDPHYTQSIDNYLEQILCSVWLDHIDKYRHSLLDTDGFSTKLLIPLTTSVLDARDEYDLCIDLMIGFGNLFSYEGFTEFCFLQDYCPSPITLLAYNAQKNLRKSIYSEPHEPSVIILNLLTGLNSGVERFVKAYKSFKTQPHDFKSWKEALAELHAEAKGNIYNIKINEEITNGPSNTYKFGQVLASRRGFRATVGCTARISHSFNRLGEDIPRYVDIVSKYLQSQQSA